MKIFYYNKATETIVFSDCTFILALIQYFYSSSTPFWLPHGLWLLFISQQVLYKIQVEAYNTYKMVHSPLTTLGCSGEVTETVE